MSTQPTERIRKPDWLKVRAPGGEKYTHIKGLVKKYHLHTVCSEAHCPNVGECWGGGTATFMVLGDLCTRGCRFCHVKSGHPQGGLDHQEPEKVADSVEKMGLGYVVLTSVDRDDLPDGGADHFGRVVEAIKAKSSNVLVEVLIPDFQNMEPSLKRMVDSGAEVIGHNIETVKRLTPSVRDPRASYEQSLAVLKKLKELKAKVFTKSSVLVGLGESLEELTQTVDDLRAVGVDIVTFGQYLQPSKKHLTVERFVTPEEFKELDRLARLKGFLYVASGALVRSSYRAGELFMEGLLRKKKQGELIRD